MNLRSVDNLQIGATVTWRETEETNCWIKSLFYIFFAYKKYSRHFIIFRLNHWWQILTMSFILFWALTVFITWQSMGQSKVFRRRTKLLRVWNDMGVSDYIFIFIFMHLADAFIQSHLQCIPAIHVLSLCVFPGNRTHNLLRC